MLINRLAVMLLVAAVLAAITAAAQFDDHLLRQRDAEGEAVAKPSPTGAGPHHVTGVQPLELLYVTGCPVAFKETGSTQDCAMDGGGSPSTRLTLRGRGFRRTDPVNIALIPAKRQGKNKDTFECVNPRRSGLLPSLLLTCDLPKVPAPGPYHVQITMAHGAVIRRYAVVYKQMGKTDGAGETEGKGAQDDASAAFASINLQDYRTLGVGGLGPQFRELFRRAFASRLKSSAKVTAQLGMRHVKGVILHGPPGTGKTLIARKISELLHAKNVQVVSGPEIMSKFVGDSEKNLRALFAVAEHDYERNKENADLHVIIFDEIDAIMRHRGGGDDSAARAVYDSVTTQMLAYMDGVKSQNNLLLIGLTNRLEALDKALLRPGRFEVQIRIPLPDFRGRLQILEIHTQGLKTHRYLTPDVDLKALARETASFSGADIEGLVRSAISHGFQRMQRAERLKQAQETSGAATSPSPATTSTFYVSQADLQRGYREVLSSKGSVLNTSPYLVNGVVSYSDHVPDIVARFDLLTQRMRSVPFLRSMKTAIVGQPGSGKTAIAALVAQRSQFSYVAMLTPDSMIGLSVEEKIRKISETFDAAANVAHACIVLDNIEDLVEYNAQYNRVNIAVQQELSALLARPPLLTAMPKDSDPRLLVIVTTSSTEVLKIVAPHGFDLSEELPLLSKAEMALVLQAYHVFDKEGIRQVMPFLPSSLSIKRLLFYVDVGRAYATHAVARVSPIDNLVDPITVLPDADTDEEADEIDGLLTRAAVPAETSATPQRAAQPGEADVSQTDWGEEKEKEGEAPKPAKTVRGRSSASTVYPTVSDAAKDDRTPRLFPKEFIQVLEEFGASSGTAEISAGDTFDAVTMSY